MKILAAIALVFLSLPLGAQEWDLRAEVPYANGQNLPQTILTGSNQAVNGTLDKGSGSILTGSWRIIRVGPILKLEWCAEVVQMQASGQINQSGSPSQGSTLSQKGFGLGLNAQLWIPFTGIAAEVGVIERVNQYSFQTGGAGQSQNLVQPWMRIGLRLQLPIPEISPYICASYQQPINASNPLVVNSAADLAALLSAQGTGQQFNRVWTFGVGLMF